MRCCTEVAVHNSRKREFRCSTMAAYVKKTKQFRELLRSLPSIPQPPPKRRKPWLNKEHGESQTWHHKPHRHCRPPSTADTISTERQLKLHHSFVVRQQELKFEGIRNQNCACPCCSAERQLKLHHSFVARQQELKFEGIHNQSCACPCCRGTCLPGSCRSNCDFQT